MDDSINDYKNFMNRRFERKVNGVVGIRWPCPKCGGTKLVTVGKMLDEGQDGPCSYTDVQCKACGFSLEHNDETNGEHYPFDHDGAVKQWQLRVEKKVNLRDACLAVDKKEAEEFLEQQRDNDRIEKFFEAIKLCQQDAKAKYELEPGHAPENSLQGSVKCPVCGNDLYYSISSYNGHLWGKCSGDNCLAWMQ